MVKHEAVKYYNRMVKTGTFEAGYLVLRKMMQSTKNPCHGKMADN